MCTPIAILFLFQTLRPLKGANGLLKFEGDVSWNTKQWNVLFYDSARTKFWIAAQL